MNVKETLTATWTREGISLHKYSMISPLLDPDLDPAAALERRNSIAKQNGITERTLCRYVAAYRESGCCHLRISVPHGSYQCCRHKILRLSQYILHNSDYKTENPV